MENLKAGFSHLARQVLRVPFTQVSDTQHPNNLFRNLTRPGHTLLLALQLGKDSAKQSALLGVGGERTPSREDLALAAGGLCK